MNEEKKEPVSLAEALPLEIKRVQELIELYRSIGPAGVFAIGFMRYSLGRAIEAMASGDLVGMIRAYDDLKGYTE
jgi:hypothetical protein